MYNIQLDVNDTSEREKLVDWLSEEFRTNFHVLTLKNKRQYPQFLIVEIEKLFDWVLLNRIRKQHKDLIILPLIHSKLLHTVPLALQLELPLLFIKPLKKSVFIRNIKRVLLQTDRNLYTNSKASDNTIKENQVLQEVFLRRLLRGEVTSEQEIIESRLFSPKYPIPNTVYFIQGFIKNSVHHKLEEWQAPQLVQRILYEHFSKEIGKVFFLPYRKHLLMLLHLPSTIVSPHHWKNGEEITLKVIQLLMEKYGIHLYVGVGSIYSEPLQLHHSYKEAKKARRTPPYNRLSLRFFEETAKDQHIQKSIEYIANHFTEDISAKVVAAHINFSPTYFSRLFRKETGRSFVEYVTFVRLQRAIALLRHSNHTIEQIAVELGFNTPNYFSNIFKKYAGISPSEYRATKEIHFF